MARQLAVARRHWIEAALLAVCALASACGTGLPSPLGDDASMREIFERHAPASQPAVAVPRRAVDRVVSPFPLLDNPMLLLWVHPHFSGGSEPLPVPGYVTALPLYARDHFALPGESALP